MQVVYLGSIPEGRNEGARRVTQSRRKHHLRHCCYERRGWFCLWDAHRMPPQTDHESKRLVHLFTSSWDAWGGTAPHLWAVSSKLLRAECRKMCLCEVGCWQHDEGLGVYPLAPKIRGCVRDGQGKWVTHQREWCAIEFTRISRLTRTQNVNNIPNRECVSNSSHSKEIW